ncbi:MAG TPA: hypothetical protein VFY28_02770 [Candidatus Paceibacterota bacterium]|nr:hypothetical protein [Candidatus Paceibacterota bacterium]
MTACALAPSVRVKIEAVTLLEMFLFSRVSHGDLVGPMVRFISNALLEEREIELVFRTAGDLTNSSRATVPRQLIYDCALEQGLKKCPPEAAFALANLLRDASQEMRGELFVGEGTTVLMGMDPLPSRKGEPRIYFIDSKPSMTLMHGDYGDRKHEWGADSLWAFMR